eukprot:768357-Hanusia_phi.AAC.1
MPSQTYFHPRIASALLLLLITDAWCDDPLGGDVSAGSPVVDGKYPNYMIPVWKERMIAHANNLTEEGIQIFLDSMRTGHKYKLVAYQGCRIIGLLANFDRDKYGNEIRERVANLGGITATTMAMGSHMVSAQVQSMGCFAIQALVDGHKNHTHQVIELGAVDVVSWVLQHHGALDADIAEYCSAAVASLAYDPLGASRLVRQLSWCWCSGREREREREREGRRRGRELGGGGGEGEKRRTCYHHHHESTPEQEARDTGESSSSAISSECKQIYCCVALQRLIAGDQKNLERVKQNKDVIFAIVDAIKTFNAHPTVVSVCGGLIRSNSNTYLPPTS